MTDKKEKEKVVEISSEDLQKKFIVPSCAKAHMISGLIFFHLAKLKLGKENEDFGEKLNDVFRAWAAASEDIYGSELCEKTLEESFEFYKEQMLKKDGKRSWSISFDSLKVKKDEK